MKEIKEDEYSNSLATILVCAMLCVGDTQTNVLIKLKLLGYLWRLYVCVPLRGTNMATGSLQKHVI